MAMLPQQCQAPTAGPQGHQPGGTLAGAGSTGLGTAHPLSLLLLTALEHTQTLEQTRWSSPGTRHPRTREGRRSWAAVRSATELEERCPDAMECGQAPARSVLPRALTPGPHHTLAAHHLSWSETGAALGLVKA